VVTPRRFGPVVITRISSLRVPSFRPETLPEALLGPFFMIIPIHGGSGRETLMAVKKSIVAPAPAAKPAPSKSKSAKGPDTRFQQARKASILLKHVSDPTRLQVILILAEGEKHVGALCEQLSQSQPAVSHHLALLRHGGIISPRRQGKNNYYSLTETGGELAKVVKTLTN